MKSKDLQWENSLDGINYSLKVLGSEQTEDRRLICQTLQRIPKKVRDKVLENVIFVIFSDGVYGHSAALNIREISPMEKIPFGHICKHKKSLILLNFYAMQNERLPLSSRMQIIAHEIAHFIYGDENYSEDDGAEKRADNLARKWGFKK